MIIASGALRNLGVLLTTSWRHSPSLFPLEALQFSCDIQVFRSPPVNCCVWHKVVGEVYFFPRGHQLVHQHLRFLFPQWIALHLCWKSKCKHVPPSGFCSFCWSRRILFQEHLSWLLQRCRNWHQSKSSNSVVLLKIALGILGISKIIQNGNTRFISTCILDQFVNFYKHLLRLQLLSHWIHRAVCGENWP